MSADDVKGAASSKGERPPRLYVKGAFVTFRRSNANQRNHCAILQIDGVNNKEDVDFYLGKRVAYIYKAPKARAKYSRVEKESGKQTSRFRVIWGKIQRAHGNNGLVRSAFQKNLPPRALGGSVRIMLYPSRI
mmetsp:Transcript_20934/g.29340  ORF Transcript_20934/g.29340 Transcript_20934/m.29340 type:complete len:133 (-) Transcript_20934:339-737(-)|eukprot:CAMPEP_0185252864 /NCGR_PEP_ID=MMETSP1359-20130426/1827_1 /TAXON_ID=552665 /ORGANISM="Bigelowiella longifila, Strain CCMP242" /LENGTH=132 /DNA_ID=CAMNT_0027835129 /DNA_START=22 /DNA_END=420 /DNA_ORIENTATION=-